MKKIFLVLLLCLSITNIANAQCAWILWEKVENPSARFFLEWTMKNGYKTHEQCQKAKKNAYETTKTAFLKNGYRVIDDTEDLLMMGVGREGIPSIYHAWMCLPDTVDPRK